eukprot:6841571-Heterocapsa_arctica.AAC.1
MGRMIEELRFTSVWSPDHVHFWKHPETQNWKRLVIENFVPQLAAHADQSGIEEALEEIFCSKARPTHAQGATGAPARLATNPLDPIDPTAGEPQIDTASTQQQPHQPQADESVLPQ